MLILSFANKDLHKYPYETWEVNAVLAFNVIDNIDDDVDIL